MKNFMGKNMKKLVLISLLAASVAACGGGGGAGGGSGRAQTETYEGYEQSGPINNYDITEIQTRQLDMVNAIRAENGAGPVQLSPQLTDASITQARDIAAQQRAWNYGSDKSTPQTRAQRAGFNGVVTGENVSETFRGELDVMQSWLREPMARSVVTNPSATHVGIGYFMERNGKVWWVQDFGAMGVSPMN